MLKSAVWLFTACSISTRFAWHLEKIFKVCAESGRQFLQGLLGISKIIIVILDIICLFVIWDIMTIDWQMMLDEMQLKTRLVDFKFIGLVILL